VLSERTFSASALIKPAQSLATALQLHHPQCNYVYGAATEARKGGQQAFPPTDRVANGNLVSDVQAQEACNNDDNYHYADDVENVHCVLRSSLCAISI
jgi:hypothetical protein